MAQKLYRFTLSVRSPRGDVITVGEDVLESTMVLSTNKEQEIEYVVDEILLKKLLAAVSVSANF